MKKNAMMIMGVLIITILIACGSGGAGDYTTTVIPSNLYAWGNNSWGQFGDGTITDANAPGNAIGSEIWKQVDAGEAHTVAIDNVGALYAWGNNSGGQLGNGTIIDTNVPGNAIGLNTWVQVSAGGSHTVAIDNTGTLYAWGYNGKGQLGIGTEMVNGNEGLFDKYTPVQVGTKTWDQVSAGDNYVVAIDSDGKLYTWGENNKGQLGRGDTIDTNVPGNAIGTKTWKQVSAGGADIGGGSFSHVMAIDDSNELYAWGYNGFGQLGIGTEMVNGNEEVVDKHAPVKVGTKTWTQVGVGIIYTIAIDSDGKLYAWGYNGFGQLGIGTETVNGNEELVDKYTPVEVVLGTNTTKTWTQVSVGAGGAFTVVLDADGLLYAWGRNEQGQLGNGNIIQQNTPVKIGDRIWDQVSAGGYHTVGITQ